MFIFVVFNVCLLSEWQLLVLLLVRGLDILYKTLFARKLSNLKMAAVGQNM